MSGSSREGETPAIEQGWCLRRSSRSRKSPWKIANRRRCPYGDSNPAPVYVRASVDAVLGEVITERALADAHQLIRIFLHTAGLFECATNRFALHPFEIGVQPQRWQSRRRGGGRTEQRYRRARDEGAGRQDNRSLDRVLQFAHVPRPVVLQQQIGRASCRGR